jgi:hypothetical protein
VRSTRRRRAAFILPGIELRRQLRLVRIRSRTGALSESRSVRAFQLSFESYRVVSRRIVMHDWSPDYVPSGFVAALKE